MTGILFKYYYIEIIILFRSKQNGENKSFHKNLHTELVLHQPKKGDKMNTKLLHYPIT